MSYDYEYQQPRQGLPLAGKIAIGCVAVVAILFAAAFGLGMYARANFNPEDEFAEVLKLTPEVKGFSDAARTYFPGEFAQMHDQAIEAIKAGDKPRAQRMMVQFVKDFMHNHAGQAAAASDKALMALLSARVGASSVADSVRGVCMNATGNLTAEKFELTAPQSAVLELYVRRYVEAAANGRDHPQAHPIQSYSDQQMLQAKLQAKGVPWVDLVALENPAAGEADALRKCHVAHMLHKSLMEMPPKIAVRFVANIIRSS